jgi:hypothetical protein
MRILGEQVKELLAFCYGLVVATLSFIGVLRLLSHRAEKRYARHLRETKANLEYMSIRTSIDESLLDEWNRLQVYAQWLRDRMTRKAGKPRHAQGVSDEEVKELLNDCALLLQCIKRAQCFEHGVIKTLPSNDGIIISIDDHNRWHEMQHRIECIQWEFTALMKNKYRNTVH